MPARNGEILTNVYYGRYGTPTTFALEETVAALEEADKAVAVPSGMGAIAGALMSFVGTGDHVLMVDTVYEPTRFCCDTQLKKFGVETTYYDPLVGADIGALIRPNTKVVYLESPGSHTFEIQDVPAIAAAALPRAVSSSWTIPGQARSISNLTATASIWSCTRPPNTWSAIPT